MRAADIPPGTTCPDLDIMPEAIRAKQQKKETIRDFCFVWKIVD